MDINNLICTYTCICPSIYLNVYIYICIYIYYFAMHGFMAHGSLALAVAAAALLFAVHGSGAPNKHHQLTSCTIATASERRLPAGCLHLQ
jgi:hypothetical protein